MKGQSAVEYLITYGWMLVAVGIGGGVAYSTVQPNCQAEITGFQSNQLSIDDEGLTEENLFAVVLESQASERITVNRITLETDNTTINRNREVVVDPSEPQLYEIVEIEPDDTSCIEADFTIDYDLGPLTDQRAVGSAQIPASLVQAIENFLSVGGGEIEALQVNSSMMRSQYAQGDNICIGGDCTPIRQSDDTPIERDGDVMSGSLETNNLEMECIGNDCTYETGTATGEVSNINNSMDGTLNVTEIRPITSTCIGDLSSCE
jgi:rhodanese-related sulfurtransferase